MRDEVVRIVAGRAGSTFDRALVVRLGEVTADHCAHKAAAEHYHGDQRDVDDVQEGCSRTSPPLQSGSLSDLAAAGMAADSKCRGRDRTPSKLRATPRPPAS